MSSTNAKMHALVTVAAQFEDLSTPEARDLLGAVLPGTSPAKAAFAACIVRQHIVAGDISSPGVYIQAVQAALADKTATDLVVVGSGVGS